MVKAMDLKNGVSIDHGIHEAVGSIPSRSTRDYKWLADAASPFFVIGGQFVPFYDIPVLTEVALERKAYSHERPSPA